MPETNSEGTYKSPPPVAAAAGFVPNMPPGVAVEPPKSPPVAWGCCCCAVTPPNSPPVCAGCACVAPPKRPPVCAGCVAVVVAPPNSPPAAGCCCWAAGVCPNRPPVCCVNWGWAAAVVWPNRPPVCWGCAAGVWVVVAPKRLPGCWGCWGCEVVAPNKEPACAGWEAAVPKSPPPAGGVWVVLLDPLRGREVSFVTASTLMRSTPTSASQLHCNSQEIGRACVDAQPSRAAGRPCESHFGGCTGARDDSNSRLGWLECDCWVACGVFVAAVCCLCSVWLALVATLRRLFLPHWPTCRSLVLVAFAGVASDRLPKLLTLVAAKPIRSIVARHSHLDSAPPIASLNINRSQPVIAPFPIPACLYLTSH